MSADGEWITEDDVIYDLIEKAQLYDIIDKENRSLNRKLTKKEKFTENIATTLAESKSEQSSPQIIMPSMQYNQALIPMNAPPLPPSKPRLFLPKKVEDDDNSPKANKARLKNEVNKVFDGTIKLPSEIMNECEPTHLGAKVIVIEEEVELLIVSEEEKEKKSNSLGLI